MSATSLSTPPPAAPAAEGSQRHERMSDVEARVGLKKSQLWKLIREGRFPKPIKCGRASLFIVGEIDRWVQDRIRESRGGAA